MTIDPADLAWADALEAAVGALSRYTGRSPGGSSVEGQELSWVAAAAFAGGIAQLAYDCERANVPWPQLRERALRELAEITKRRASRLDADAQASWGQLPLPGLFGS